MPTQIVAVSGCKFSGKSTLCLYIQAYLSAKRYNRKYRKDFSEIKLSQSPLGEIQWHDPVPDSFPDYELTAHTMNNDICIYNFADTLKQLCIDLLGLTPEQVWGTEEQKNTLTPFVWENLPQYVQWMNSDSRSFAGYEYDQVQQDRVKKTRSYPDIYSEHGYLTMLQLGYVPLDHRTGRMTARQVLQVVGTDVMRKMFYNDIWVDATVRRINKEAKSLALIADMRFRGEFQKIHDVGGYVIRLERKVFPNDRHASEVDFDNFDFNAHPRTLVVPADADLETKNRLVISWLESTVLNALEVTEVPESPQPLSA